MILRKIIKIAATRCHILKLKCTKKFDFGWGSDPDPAGGAYSAPPNHLAGFKGPTSKGRGGSRNGEGREGRDGDKGREGIGGRGREGKENGGSPTHYFRLKSCTWAYSGRGGLAAE